MRCAGAKIKGGYQSGQMGQTVNLLSFDFGGSNPSPPTKKFAETLVLVIPSNFNLRLAKKQTSSQNFFAEIAQSIEH